MKMTRDVAKTDVAVYGELLKERAVISDITEESQHDKVLYIFNINSRDGMPDVIVCEGIKQLAVILKSMWSTYIRARQDLGIIDTEPQAFPVYEI